MDQQTKTNLRSTNKKTSLSVADKLLAAALRESRGRQIRYTAQDAFVPNPVAVCDIGHVIDYSIQDFLRSQFVSAPALLSIFFDSQFSSALVGKLQDNKLIALRAAVLAAANATRLTADSTKLSASVSVIANEFGLETSDVLPFLQRAVDKMTSTFTIESARLLSVAVAADNDPAYLDFEKRMAVPFISAVDAVNARDIISSMAAQFENLIDPMTIFKSAESAANAIPAFRNIMDLVLFNMEYNLPRVLTPLGALVQSVRTSQPKWLENIQIPQRISRPNRAEGKKAQSSHAPVQHKYYQIDPTAAGRISIADILTGIHELDTRLFSMPTQNVDFNLYVESAVTSALQAFSPRPPIVGTNPYSADGVLNHFWSLFAARAVFSQVRSPLESSVLALIQNYKQNNPDIKTGLIQCERMVRALSIIVEVPVHALNFMIDLAHAHADLSLLVGDTQMTPQVVDRWLAVREAGLTPLRNMAPAINTYAYYHSVTIADGLPRYLSARIPSSAILSVDPLTTMEGEVVKTKMPVPRTYDGDPVYLTNSSKIAQAHYASVRTLVPSAIRHTALSYETVPIVTEQDIADIIRYVHVDNFTRVTELEPQTVRAMAAHASATAAGYHDLGVINLRPALMLQTSTYLDPVTTRSEPRLNAPFTSYSDNPQLITGLPPINPGYYAELAPEFVIIYSYENAFLHQDALNPANPSYHQMNSSTAPIYAVVPLSFTGSIALDVKEIAEAGPSTPVQNTPAPEAPAAQKKQTDKTDAEDDNAV